MLDNFMDCGVEAGCLSTSGSSPLIVAIWVFALAMVLRYIYAQHKVKRLFFTAYCLAMGILSLMQHWGGAAMMLVLVCMAVWPTWWSPHLDDIERRRTQR